MVQDIPIHLYDMTMGGWMDENIDKYFLRRVRRIRTRMPTLIRAYKYANLLAMGSFDALKRATANVPIKTDILR